MSESLDRCTTCKNGYVERESIGEFIEFGSKRFYHGDNCKRPRTKMGLHEYIELDDDVKTKVEA